MPFTPFTHSTRVSDRLSATSSSITASLPPGSRFQPFLIRNAASHRNCIRAANSDTAADTIETANAATLIQMETPISPLPALSAGSVAMRVFKETVMHQQVEFQAAKSATVAGQWVGLVVDAASQRVLTRTGLTYATSDQARFGARIKWQGREAKLQMAQAQRVPA